MAIKRKIFAALAALALAGGVAAAAAHTTTVTAGGHAVTSNTPIQDSFPYGAE
ncbi:MAG TPA: hypothetical protein VGG16_20240 [Streptosporangiaceae bacterium]|jgi:hypothetical protein